MVVMGYSIKFGKYLLVVYLTAHLSFQWRTATNMPSLTGLKTTYHQELFKFLQGSRENS